jgi:hypothetical protein
MLLIIGSLVVETSQPNHINMSPPLIKLQNFPTNKKHTQKSLNPMNLG